MEEIWKRFAKKAGLRTNNEDLKIAFEEAVKESSTFRKIQRICHADRRRMISWHMANSGIPSLVKDIAKDKGKRATFLEILNWVSTHRDRISSKRILKEFGWSGHTYGDFVLRCLELLVCLGTLTKLRFATGRPGHLYIRGGSECEFALVKRDAWLIPNRFTCLFDWNKAVSIKRKFP